jgi:flagellar hook assembly protein FlgD
MKSKYTFILLLTFLMAVKTNAQWISFERGKTDQQAPQMELLQSDLKSCTFKISMHGVLISDIKNGVSSFKAADLLSGKLTNETGFPELAYFSEVIAIPDNAILSYAVIEKGETVTIKDIEIPGARASWLESASGEPVYDFVKSAKNKTWPEQEVKISPSMKLRDLNIVQVAVYPMTYNADKKELNIVKNITVKINFGENASASEESKELSTSFSFNSIYKNAVLNYDLFSNRNVGDRAAANEIVLYLMPDKFEPYFKDYIKWKKQSGFRPIIKKFSEIGASAATDPNTIKTFITNMYKSADKPAYVVFVGDDGVFPKKIVTAPDTFPSYDYANDNFFVTVDGNDYLPDIISGRMPLNNKVETDNLLNKITLYEKTPFTNSTTNPNWFKKGLMCSNNDYVSQVNTKRYVAKVLLDEGKFVSVDTMMSDKNCTYGLSKVKKALAEGRGFVNYRGEGWYEGWHASCYVFDVSEINSINNGRMQPFFTSIGCGVGCFDSKDGNAFGEQWLKTGTVASPKGTFCFVGPVSNSHTAYNNPIDRGIYDGLFKLGQNTAGESLLNGKMAMYNEEGATATFTETQMNEFIVLGDPSSKVWKTTPVPANGLHVSTVPTGSQSITVNVKYASNSAPVTDANVNILGNNICVNAATNNLGNAVLNIDPTTIGDVYEVTATSPTIIPYIGTFTVSSNQGVNDVVVDKSALKISPNPFSSNTMISYTVSDKNDVSLVIQDVLGKEIKSLVNEVQKGGDYKVEWNGTDNQGNAISEGMYLCVCKIGNYISVTKFIKTN